MGEVVLLRFLLLHRFRVEPILRRDVGVDHMQQSFLLALLEVEVDFRLMLDWRQLRSHFLLVLDARLVEPLDLHVHLDRLRVEVILLLLLVLAFLLLWLKDEDKTVTFLTVVWK
jgi:hypothetical protein